MAWPPGILGGSFRLSQKSLLNSQRERGVPARCAWRPVQATLELAPCVRALYVSF